MGAKKALSQTGGVVKLMGPKFVEGFKSHRRDMSDEMRTN